MSVGFRIDQIDLANQLGIFSIFRFSSESMIKKTGTNGWSPFLAKKKLFYYLAENR